MKFLEKDKYPEFEPLCPFGPLSEAGVYGVFEYDEHHIATLLYVGASKNIQKRVLAPNHHYIKLYRSGRNVCTRSIATDNYVELEKELIKKYKPELNIIHNG